MRHFNVDTIAGQWKYHVLKIIQNGEYHDSKIKKKPWTLFPNFTGKTKDSSLMSVTVTSTAQRVLSDILEDTSPVLLLPNTRLLRLMMIKLLSFSMTLLTIKRKLSLQCLLKNLSHRFSFTYLLKTLKW